MCAGVSDVCVCVGDVQYACQDEDEQNDKEDQLLPLEREEGVCVRYACVCEDDMCAYVRRYLCLCVRKVCMCAREVFLHV